MFSLRGQGCLHLIALNRTIKSNMGIVVVLWEQAGTDVNHVPPDFEQLKHSSGRNDIAGFLMNSYGHCIWSYSDSFLLTSTSEAICKTF